MQSEDLTTYATWELDAPVLPERSHLYSLEPVGVGTFAVESLTSYLTRLAQVHDVTMTTLIRYKLAPLFLVGSQPLGLPKADAIKAAFSSWRRNPDMLQESAAKFWLGEIQRVEKVVEALEKLTQRQDIRYLTLLSWSQLFSLKHAFHSQQLWCPACYQDSRETESILYEPLLWALEVVEVCPLHQRYLQTWCLYCHSSQPFLKQKARPGYCCECGAWLGRWVEPLPQTRQKEEKFDWNFWAADAVGQLLASRSLLDGTQTFQCSQSTQRKRKPRLKAFLKWCYKFGVSPVDRLNLLSHASFASIR